MLTAPFLNALCPRPKDAARGTIYDAYIKALTSTAAHELLVRYGVINERRLAHFMAQIAHESGGLTLIWESGAYSDRRITQIFGVGNHSAAVTTSEAKRLAGNGPALFERVYGIADPKCCKTPGACSRMKTVKICKARELGNTQSGDGWRFRGCGPGQNTGRAAHERFAAKIGCPVNELELPINGLHAILLEWTEKSCNPLADSEDGTERALRAITKRINGGYNGLDRRRGYHRKAVKLLAGASAPTSSRSPADRKPILEIGEASADVRVLQELLTKAGYVVPVDGQMGPKKEAALAGFQVNHGLVVSGRADDPTWEMLRAVTAEGDKTPKVRQVDEVKLATESVVWKALGRIRFWAGWIWRAIFGGTVLGSGAEASGLDVFEGVGSAFDRIAAAWSRLDLPAAFSSPKGWAFIGLLLVGIGFWLFDRWAAKGQEARKDDAEIGGNLTV